jgi:hypothetical protein
VDHIAFPVRIGNNGWLQRATTLEDTVIQVLEIMARTAGDGGWRGVQEFGLRDHMMSVGTKRGLQPEAIQAANRILADLGIQWFRVDAVEKEEGKDTSEAFYRVSVFFAGKGSEVLRIRM